MHVSEKAQQLFMTEVVAHRSHYLAATQLAVHGIKLLQ